MPKVITKPPADESDEVIGSTEDLKRNDADASDAKPLKFSKDDLREALKDINMEDRLKWKLDNCSKEELEKLIEMAQEKLNKGECSCASESNSVPTSKY